MAGAYNKIHIDTIHVFSQQIGSRNIPPYAPSAYTRIFNTGTNYDARTVNAVVSVEQLWPQARTLVTNVLHSKFGSKLGDSSSFGATLTAEARETFGMLSGTVLRLARAARAVKRLDFAGCARELGLPYRERTVTKTRRVKKARRGGKPSVKYVVSRKRVFSLPSGREVEKTLASGWLFWSYGVKPLASDIYNGLDVLQRPLNYEQPVRVTASTSNQKTEVIPPDPWQSGSSFKWTGNVQGACGALVSVSNPNHYLLNKMGLANPAQWVLEAIPFSFVIDWFSNLSQVVGQWNEYLGYTFKHTWMSFKHKYERSGTYFGPYGSSQSCTGYTFKRTLSLPTPKLVFAYERFSLQRGLNAISLLVGFLPKR